MNVKERVLEFDFRPLVDEETDKQIRFIAARDGMAPSVLIRRWILEGIRRDEAVRKAAEDAGIRFSLKGEGA